MLVDDIWGVAGLIGVGFYLSSYALLQFGFIGGNSPYYTIMNLLAASFVLLSLISAFNLSSLLIQVSWITISLIGLFRIYVISRFLRFSPEETDFLQSSMPSLARPLARKFLNAGFWTDVEPGHDLLRQGETVENLIFLSRGRVQITVGAQVVGHVERGYLGEMKVLDAGAASATVMVEEPSRVFVISGKKLRGLCRRQVILAEALEKSFMSDTRRKLMKTNAKIAGNQATEPA